VTTSSAAPGGGSGSPIALSLFDRVSDYAEALETGTADIGKPLTDATPIVVFCQNFFAQLFQNVLNAPIRSIDARAKEQAATIRQQKSDDASAPLRRLLAVFEELCDEWQDVRGLSYVWYRHRALDEFHATLLPDLFEAITSWANAVDHQDLAQRSALAEAAYKKGLMALSARLAKA